MIFISGCEDSKSIVFKNKNCIENSRKIDSSYYYSSLNFSIYFPGKFEDISIDEKTIIGHFHKNDSILEGLAPGIAVVCSDQQIPIEKRYKKLCFSISENPNSILLDTGKFKNNNIEWRWALGKTTKEYGSNQLQVFSAITVINEKLVSVNIYESEGEGLICEYLPYFYTFKTSTN
jgi:hypothetical protein